MSAQFFNDATTARSSTLLNIDVTSHKETMYPQLPPITAEWLDLARAFQHIQSSRLVETFAAPAVIGVDFNGGYIVSLWLALSRVLLPAVSQQHMTLPT